MSFSIPWDMIIPFPGPYTADYLHPKIHPQRITLPPTREATMLGTIKIEGCTDDPTTTHWDVTYRIKNITQRSESGQLHVVVGVHDLVSSFAVPALRAENDALKEENRLLRAAKEDRNQSLLELQASNEELVRQITRVEDYISEFKTGGTSFQERCFRVACLARSNQAEHDRFVRQQSESNKTIGELRTMLAAEKSQRLDLLSQRDQAREQLEQARQRVVARDEDANKWAARFRWLQSHCGYVLKDRDNMCEHTAQNFHLQIDQFLEAEKQPAGESVSGTGYPKVSGIDTAAPGAERTIHMAMEGARVVDHFTELPQISRASKDFDAPLTGGHFNQLAMSINALARKVYGKQP